MMLVIWLLYPKAVLIVVDEVKAERLVLYFVEDIPGSVLVDTFACVAVNVVQ